MAIVISSLIKNPGPFMMAPYISASDFFHKYDRTIDQIVQAALWGKQNIAEASMAPATSKQTEIKLSNAARASLEELLIDYDDF